MAKLKFSPREKILLKKLAQKRLSPTHDLDHLLQVAKNALWLAKIYGGKKDVLVPAVLLHDLGRAKPRLHGRKSALASSRQAGAILKQAGYDSSEIATIGQVIESHDQPKLAPRLLEGKILKDADFLDGFGARGIWRSILYTFEAGQSPAFAIKRMGEKMRQRFENLELRESQQVAQSQFFLAQIFLQFLEEKIPTPQTFSGKYIVFEGISGTGKETQARLLARYLRQRGQMCQIVYHPSPRLKKTWREWQKDKIDSFTEGLLFLTDRSDTARRQLLPALRSGKIVLGLRNKITALVYQAQNAWQISLFEFIFSFFEPPADLVFLFEIPPRAALGRVQKRARQTGEALSKFERLSLLRAKQAGYKRVLKSSQNVVFIKAARSMAQIHKEIVQTLVERKLI